MPKVLRRVGSKVEEVDLHGYTDEREFQEILASHPGLIPGCERAAVAREFPLPGIGYVDLMLLDGDGALTVVECKLEANAEIKRKVVGQLLTYAAGLWQMTAEDFALHWRLRTEKSPCDSVAEYVPEADESKFAQALAATLSSGDFRLVFAVDQITPELRRTVEFLHESSSERLAVMALEIGRFKEGDVEILVPETYGAELAASGAAHAPSARWTLEQVVDALHGTDGASPLGGLVSHADAAGAEFKGGTAAGGPSGGFYYDTTDGRRSLWSIYTNPGSERVAINLGGIHTASAMRAEEAAKALVKAGLVDAPLSIDELARKYPAIPLGKLESARAVEAVRSALDILAGASPGLHTLTE